MSELPDAESVAVALLADLAEIEQRACWLRWRAEAWGVHGPSTHWAEPAEEAHMAGFRAGMALLARTVAEVLATIDADAAPEAAPERSTGTGWPEGHHVRAWAPPAAEPGGEEAPVTGG